MLKDLFTEFDKHCVIHDVFKLYTIGDCYVVLGLVDKRRRDEAQECKNILSMGFEMIKIIRDVRQRIEY